MNRPEIEFGNVDWTTEELHLQSIKQEVDVFESSFVITNNQMTKEVSNLRWYDDEQKSDILKSLEDRRQYLDLRHDAIASLERSPYFARLDFNDGMRRNMVYVSKGNIKSALSDHDDVKYVNWRAPIAGLLYQYNYTPIKNVRFETEKNVKTGDIDLVAKLKINDWELEDIWSSSSGANDRMERSGLQDAMRDELQERLSAASSDKMSEIVDTIQADQYEIIKQDPTKDLIIQGCAGSGKTAVALHRIAYLLYNGLDSQEILFISPNKDFSKYVSGVLPELGEVNIPIKTLDEIYKSVFNERLLPRSFQSVVEDFLNIKHKDPRINYFFSGQDDLDYKVRNHIEAARQRRQVIDRYLDALEEIRKSRYMTVKNPTISIKSSDLVWNDDNETTSGYVFEAIVGEYFDFNLYAILEAIIKNLTYPKQKINKLPERRLGNKIKSVKHIVIDEAQDYTKWQIYLLHLLCPEATFTILGDRFQTSNPYAKVYNKYLGHEDKNTFSQLLSEVDRERGTRATYLEINTAYRSSPEIVTYCNQIMGLDIVAIRDSQAMEVAEREPDGEIDFLWQLRQDVENLIALGFSRIGVVTDNSYQAFLMVDKFEKYYDTLTNLDIQVMPFYKAKGLEFDAVIAIHDFESSDELHLSEALGREIDFGQRMFYIACTRAQHKLIVYHYNIRPKG